MIEIQDRAADDRRRRIDSHAFVLLFFRCGLEKLIPTVDRDTHTESIGPPIGQFLHMPVT